MNRRAFLVALSATAWSSRRGALAATPGLRVVSRRRADRSWLRGVPGGCASRRKPHAAAGFTLAELA